LWSFVIGVDSAVIRLSRTVGPKRTHMSNIVPRLRWRLRLGSANELNVEALVGVAMSVPRYQVRSGGTFAFCTNIIITVIMTEHKNYKIKLQC